jgi:HEPN domain-containing protein
MKSETQAWLKSTEGDLFLARAALNADFLGQCLFHCEQTIEKLLKALWIEGSEVGVPDRTHELAQLAAELNLPLTAEQGNLLDFLYEQYTSSRYPDEEPEYSKEAVQRVYDQTQEFAGWLRQRLS